LPVPPLRVSLPVPPNTVSSPPRSLTVSLPPSAWTLREMSWKSVMVSLPDVPVMKPAMVRRSLPTPSAPLAPSIGT
jgi:hypothetical protein